MTKVFEVWRDGTSVYTRSGSHESGTHIKALDLGSVEAAEAALATMSDGALPAAATATAGGDALAAKIAALPRLEDDPAYLVFADWLQAQSDPWGELVALQCNAKAAKGKKLASLQAAADALLAQRGSDWLGPAGNHPSSVFEWHCGFARTAMLATPADPALIVAAIEGLVTKPIAAMLEGLVMHPIPMRFTTHRDWDSSSENVVDPWTDLAAIAKAIPAHITHVGFGGWPAPAASAYLRMPTFTAISEAFPKLRHLELTGWSTEEPGTLALPDLVRLDARFANAQASDLAAIRESDLGKLEYLSVWLGGSTNCILDDVYGQDDDDWGGGGVEYPDTYDGSDLEQMTVNEISSYISATELAELIETMPKSVTHLAIRSAKLDAEMCEAIVGVLAGRKLASLDLSGGMIDDAAVKALITPAAKKTLGKIASIDLERNLMKAATAKKVATALPKARVGSQRKGGTPELFVRYVATME